MGKKLTNDKSNGLHVKADNLPELRALIKRLARDEVLVGVPETKTERDDPESKAAGITNAALAYIHDNGAPEQNIPARPFMIPGMQDAQAKTADLLAKTARYALGGRIEKIDEGFTRVGFAVVDAIQKRIVAGIPPPLADLTVKRRAAKGRKGAQAELNRRAAGLGASLQLAKPLVDTGEMLKSITFVVRPRAARSK